MVKTEEWYIRYVDLMIILFETIYNRLPHPTRSALPKEKELFFLELGLSWTDLAHVSIPERIIVVKGWGGGGYTDLPGLCGWVSLP